jgi:hypothetical protein
MVMTPTEIIDIIQYFSNPGDYTQKKSANLAGLQQPLF